jgi:hypothetical protein
MKWAGMKIVDIAKETGMKPTTIIQYMSNGRSGRLYQAYRTFCAKMADLTKEEAFNKVKQNINLAVDTLVEEARGTKKSTSMSRIKAATSLIGIVAPELRGGGKVEIDNRQVTFKWEDEEASSKKHKKLKEGKDARDSDKVQAAETPTEVAQ